MFINQSILQATPSRKKKSQNKQIQQKLLNLSSVQSSPKKSQPNSPRPVEKSKTNQKSPKVFEPDRWLKKFNIQSTKHGNLNSREYDEEMFEKILAQETDDLLGSWEQIYQYFQKEIEQIGIEDEEEKQVYEECRNMLCQQFECEEQAHNAGMNLLVKKMLQIDDYKLRFKNEIFNLKKQIKSLKKQKQVYENQLESSKKQNNNRQQMMSALESQLKNIQMLNQKISDCKNKSYEQKDEFIEIQATEFKLSRSLEDIAQIERDYKFVKMQNQKKKQLLQIRQKIIEKRDLVELEVTPHLQRKIETMSIIRANIKYIDKMMEQALLRIEEQSFIILGLNQKCEKTQQNAQSEGILSEYRKRYSDIFFPKKNYENWSEYRRYISQLASNHRIINSRVITQAINEKQREKKLNRSYSNHQQYESDGRKTQGKFHYQKNRRNSHKKNISIPKQPRSDMKLPKLIKVDMDEHNKNQERLKEKIKRKMLEKSNNETKRRNVSQFELESIGSSEVSGEVIQIEFHERKYKQAAKN